MGLVGEEWGRGFDFLFFMSVLSNSLSLKIYSLTGIWLNESETNRPSHPPQRLNGPLYIKNHTDSIRASRQMCSVGFLSDSLYTSGSWQEGILPHRSTSEPHRTDVAYIQGKLEAIEISVSVFPKLTKTIPSTLCCKDEFCSEIGKCDSYWNLLTIQSCPELKQNVLAPIQGGLDRENLRDTQKQKPGFHFSGFDLILKYSEW